MSVQVKSDQTERQRSQLTAAKAALEVNKKSGEADWTIKFIKGVPKVVKKSALTQKN